MDESTYTLQELGDQTSIEVRTIRSYIQKGLLPSPHGRGPNAYYDQDHLDRLQAIKMLRELFSMSLSDIRRLLMQFGIGEVSFEALQQRMKPKDGESSTENDVCADVELGTLEAPERSTAPRLPEDEPSSALAFIREYKRRQQKSQTEKEPGPQRDTSPIPKSSATRQPLLKPHPADSSSSDESRSWLGLNPPENLLRILKKEVRTVQPRSRRREEWVQFEITPDIRLQVRGDFDIRQQAVFAQIADAMREILLGGTHDEDQ